MANVLLIGSANSAPRPPADRCAARIPDLRPKSQKSPRRRTAHGHQGCGGWRHRRYAAAMNRADRLSAECHPPQATRGSPEVERQRFGRPARNKRHSRPGLGRRDALEPVGECRICCSLDARNQLAIADASGYLLGMAKARSRTSRKRHVQQELFRRGGKRKGAGCPPKGRRAGSGHQKRPDVKPYHALHVVLRVVPAVGSLRRRLMYRAMREATIVAAVR